MPVFPPAPVSLVSRDDLDRFLGLPAPIDSPEPEVVPPQDESSTYVEGSDLQTSWISDLTAAIDAAQIKSLSDDNPNTQVLLIKKLHHLAFGPRATDADKKRVVLILRALAVATHEDPRESILAVRDYAAITGVPNSWVLTSSSIFPPDNWTEVTIEGLFKVLSNRYQPHEDISLAELGSGSGIIPLYVLKKLKNEGYTGKITVESFDINPESQWVSDLNKLLLASDEEGNITHPEYIDDISFKPTRSLLAGVAGDQRYDLIFGCIPQVPKLADTGMRELSDVYTPLGHPEDIDGLGLLGEALTQAEKHLSHGGAVLLNISGRPGLAAIERMAQLRGYVPEIALATQFSQHAGTDLSGFTAIEDLGRRAPFEFYIDGKMVSATQAQKTLASKKAGTSKADVSHKQYMVLFTPQQHVVDEAEQLRLIQERIGQGRLGYHGNAGIENLKLNRTMGYYLSSLMGYRVDRRLITTTPGLESAIRLEVKSKLIHSNRSVFLGVETKPALRAWLMADGFQIIDDPQEAGLVVLPLALVAGRLDQLELLLSDKSKHVLFLASPHDKLDLQKLADFLFAHYAISDQVTLLWQNLVTSDPLAFLVGLNSYKSNVRAHYAKIGYSRVGLYTEIEAERMDREFHLLSQPEATVYRRQWGWVGMPDTSFVSTPPPALIQAKASSSEVPFIDMQFGESEMPWSDAVKEHYAKGIRVDVSESAARAIAAHDVSGRLDLNFNPVQITVGYGVNPLIEGALTLIKSETPDAGVIMPMGYYGVYSHTLEAVKIPFEKPVMNSQMDEAHFEANFREGIANLKQKNKTPKAILINYPNNPTGLYYSPENLRTILRIAKEENMYVLADEIFERTGKPELRTSVFDFAGDPELGDFVRTHVIGFSGLSKDFGMGGARVGWAYALDEALVARLDALLVEKPDTWGRRLLKASMDPAFKGRFLDGHLKWLEAKRQQTVDFLTPYKAAGVIDFSSPEGGYFVDLDVSHFFGKTIKLGGKTVTVDHRGSNLDRILNDNLWLGVSHVGWSGSPNTIRLTVAIEKLDVALDRLEIFLNAFMGDGAPRKRIERILDKARAELDRKIAYPFASADDEVFFRGLADEMESKRKTGFLDYYREAIEDPDLAQADFHRQLAEWNRAYAWGDDVFFGPHDAEVRRYAFIRSHEMNRVDHRVRFVRLNGEPDAAGNALPIHVEIHEPVGREPKGVVFLVPGGYESVFMYKQELHRFTQEGYTVVAADVRGEGFSGKPMGIESYLDSGAAVMADLQKVLDYIGAQPDLGNLPLNGYAYSRGGMLLSVLDKLNPGKFSALTLLAPALRLPIDLENIMRMRLAGDDIEWGRLFQKDLVRINERDWRNWVKRGLASNVQALPQGLVLMDLYLYAHAYAAVHGKSPTPVQVIHATRDHWTQNEKVVDGAHEIFENVTAMPVEGKHTVRHEEEQMDLEIIPSMLAHFEKHAPRQERASQAVVTSGGSSVGRHISKILGAMAVASLGVAPVVRAEELVVMDPTPIERTLVVDEIEEPETEDAHVAGTQVVTYNPNPQSPWLSPENLILTQAGWGTSIFPPASQPFLGALGVVVR